MNNYYTNFFHVRIPLWKDIRGWLSDRSNLFFVLLIVVHLLPIWLFKYFPSQDGAAHVHNANVLREYYFPDRTAFREYYVLNKDLVPNWSSHLVMAGLMHIVSPLVAEKILLSGYVILLPISIRYALQAIRLDAGFLAFVAFPFIYNYPLHMGFYNFSYSLPMFFFVVGYWLKYHNRFTLGKVVTLTLLSLLLYFCHLFSLVTAYVAIALLTIWLTVLDIAQQSHQQRSNLRSLTRSFRLRALVPLCAFLPTLILVVMFFLRPSTASAKTIWRPVPLWEQALKLFSLSSIASYDRLELLFSTALAGLFVAVSLYLLRSKVVHRQINGWDGFLLIVATYVVIYFITPDKMSGGGTIKERLLVYPFFALILWFGTHSYHRLVKQRIQLVAVGIALILLGLHTIKYAELNNYLEEYLSGMHLIEQNTTLLPLSFSHFGHTPDGQRLSWRQIGPFRHAAGYIAAQRGIVDLANYEAAKGYFPTIFRPQLNSYKYISIEQKSGNMEVQPPRVDFLTYPQRTGGRVDYVLLWDVRDEQRDNVYTKSIFRQLQEGYELIYTSPQRGFMHLYRRKDWKQ